MAIKYIHKRWIGNILVSVEKGGPDMTVRIVTEAHSAFSTLLKAAPRSRGRDITL